MDTTAAQRLAAQLARDAAVAAIGMIFRHERVAFLNAATRPD
jgi:hypothetical protein